MGLFDTVYINCPYCQEIQEHQTKSGDCMLRTYTIGSAPFHILESVQGIHECYSCHKLYNIEPETSIPEIPFIVRKIE